MSGQDPLKELMSVQKRMNALFEDALSRTNFGTTGLDVWEPVADQVRTPEGFEIHLELPGMRLAAIDVRIDGDRLIIAGERRRESRGQDARFNRVERSYGRFERSFHLPSDVDRSRVDATYRNGVLTVMLPASGSADVSSLRVEVKS